MKKIIIFILTIVSCIGIVNLKASSVGVNLNTSQEYFTYSGVQYSKRDVYEYQSIQFSGNNIYDLHSYNIDLSGWGSINQNGNTFTSTNNTLDSTSYDFNSKLQYTFDIVNNIDNVATNNILMKGLLTYERTFNDSTFNPRYMWITFSNIPVLYSDLVNTQYTSQSANELNLSYTQRFIDFNFGLETSGITCTAYYDVSLITQSGIENYVNNSGKRYNTLTYDNNRFYIFPNYNEWQTIVNDRWITFDNLNDNTIFWINKLVLLIDFGSNGFSNSLVGEMVYPLYTYNYVKTNYNISNILDNYGNYNQGFQDGLNATENIPNSFLEPIFNFFNRFFGIEIGNGIKIGYIAIIPILFGVIGLILYFWRKD